MQVRWLSALHCRVRSVISVQSSTGSNRDPEPGNQEPTGKHGGSVQTRTWTPAYRSASMAHWHQHGHGWLLPATNYLISNEKRLDLVIHKHIQIILTDLVRLGVWSMWCHAAVKTSASRKKTISFSLHMFRKLIPVSSLRNMITTGSIRYRD